MDHHCVWTNNCIGIGNYKQFLQLNLFGIWAAWYTSLTIYLVEDQLSPFLHFCRLWDFAIAQLILGLCAFNLYVMATGLTYLEFKNWMDLSIVAKQPNPDPD
jgi:hypothetical protein